VVRVPGWVNGGIEGERGSARHGSEDNVGQIARFEAIPTFTALSAVNVGIGRNSPFGDCPVFCV
jgi:hypothetical protein